MSPDALRNQQVDSSMRVVIIGGGVMGAATASFLGARYGIRATVIERDVSYARASSALSVCAIRQQFSTEINIRISQQSLAFYRDIGTHLAVGADRPSIGLVEPGYLYLATSAGAHVLEENQALQTRCGAAVALLSPGELARRFPWLSLDQIALGSLGLSTATSGEGWFDGYSALQAFRHHAIAQGAHFVEAEAVDFDVRDGAVQSVITATGDRIAADAVLIAAGAWSSPLAGMLGFDLPVRARKRDVFSLQA
ncbi:FAD-dependent oxidoreductase, partial [Gemmatimonas sp.]|uniref:NAD(P)/FAD-dependent oxidoreductase n=1 Tax=Gemmatimonas sp. TaxID=1962908 RepID=UPI00286AD542